MIILQSQIFIQCKPQKSKVLIEAMDKRKIAKFCLLLLHKMENDEFDAIIKWFECNECDMEQFKIWYNAENAEYDGSDDIINNLFGGWSKLRD